MACLSQLRKLTFLEGDFATALKVEACAVVAVENRGFPKGMSTRMARRAASSMCRDDGALTGSCGRNAAWAFHFLLMTTAGNGVSLAMFRRALLQRVARRFILRLTIFVTHASLCTQARGSAEETGTDAQAEIRLESTSRLVRGT